MSREPQSPSNLYRHALARSGGVEEEPVPEAKPTPKPPRVRVEGAPTPLPPLPRDAAFTKLATTTEALTEEERRIVRGYRLSMGGEAARLARMQIEAKIAKENLRKRGTGSKFNRGYGGRR